MEKYESKAKTSVIKYTTRTSMKIGNTNNYYTFEYGEERIIPDEPGVDLEKEKEILITKCNQVVDDQLEEVSKLYK